MNEVRTTLEEVLLASAEGVHVVAVEVADASVRVEARSTMGGAFCPSCGR
ncbi:hypothetical protein [Streptomyces goshikiensis]